MSNTERRLSLMVLMAAAVCTAVLGKFTQDGIVGGMILTLAVTLNVIAVLLAPHVPDWHNRTQTGQSLFTALVVGAITFGAWGLLYVGAAASCVLMSMSFRTHPFRNNRHDRAADLLIGVALGAICLTIVGKFAFTGIPGVMAIGAGIIANVLVVLYAPRGPNYKDGMPRFMWDCVALSAIVGAINFGIWAALYVLGSVLIFAVSFATRR